MLAARIQIEVPSVVIIVTSLAQGGGKRLKENNCAMRKKEKTKKTAAMATVAEGIDCFHSYSFFFSLIHCHCDKQDAHLSELWIHQTSTSWNMPC